MSSSDELPGPPPDAPPAAPAPAPAPSGAPLDPRLKGQQASPAPTKEPLPIVPLVLGGGVLLIAAILIFNRKGDEPEPKPAAAPTVVAGAPTKPLEGSARPEIRHAEAWEKSAEALGEIEKHLNRAKLIFEDIDKAMDDLAGGQQQLRWRGGGGAADGAVAPEGAVPPPTGEPGEGAPAGEMAAPPPAAKLPPTHPEALRIWNRWRGDWEGDLAVITSMLPDPSMIDSKLLPGYQAVAELIAGCRRLPKGNPPSRAERESWLRKLQNQSVAVRATLEKSR